MSRIVHVGLPKTATTFLQWKVFPYLAGLHYVDYSACTKIFQQIIYGDPLDYSIEEIKTELVSKEQPTLYSFESLAGSPFYYKGIGRSTVPQTLKALGFDKVIITIRNQEKAIDSYYRQFVAQGGTLSFKNWLDLNDRRPIPQKYFRHSYLKYDGLLRKYLHVFGKENILLLTQEELNEDREKFINKIAAFTHSSYKVPPDFNPKKSNQSLTNLSILLLRFINHFTFSSIRPFHMVSRHISSRTAWKLFAAVLDPYLIRFFSRRRSYISKYRLEQEIQALYKKSNEELRKDWGIDYLN